MSSIEIFFEHFHFSSGLKQLSKTISFLLLASNLWHSFAESGFRASGSASYLAAQSPNRALYDGCPHGCTNFGIL